MENQLSRFRYIPTLSRAKEDSGWTGERGRVTPLIKKYVLKGANMDVYICRNPEMLESCLEMIKERGIPKDQIYFDKFS